MNNNLTESIRMRRLHVVLVVFLFRSIQGDVECGGSYNHTRLKLREPLRCDCTQQQQSLIHLQHETILDLDGYPIECRNGRTMMTNLISITGDFNTITNGKLVVPTEKRRDRENDLFAVQVWGSHNVISWLHIMEPSCKKCSMGSGIRLEGSHNTVANVEMKRPATGIRIVGGENNSVRDVTIREAQTHAILVEGGANHTIQDTQLRLLLGPAITVRQSINTVVSRVTVSLSSGGIQIVDGVRNQVLECDIDSRGVVPIELLGNGTEHTITENSLAGKARFAIYVDSGVTNSTITVNTASKDFHTWNRGPIFYENQVHCDTSGIVWSDNEGGLTGCEYQGVDATAVTEKYAARIFDYLSTAQYSVLAGLLFTSSFLSFFGSGMIVYLILCKRKTEVTLFHRILLGLCVTDCISSLCVFLQPILLPSDTMMPLAVGNMASCRFVGFGVYFFLASTIYFCELALYFSLTVTHGYSERRAAQRMEPWVHIVPWVTVLVHNCIALAFDVVQPSSVLGLCLIGCAQEFGKDRCVEGINPDVARFMQIPSAIIPPICAVLGTVWTAGVYMAVRRQDMRNSRYEFDHGTNRNSEPATKTRRFSLWGSSSCSSSEVGLEFAGRRMSLPTMLQSPCFRTQRKRSRAVARQAFRYCASYLNSFVGVLVWTIVRLMYELNREMRLGVSRKPTGLYVALLVAYAVHPLLGFLNWLTYVRPIVERFREHYPQKSRVWAYGKLLMGHQPPISSRRPRLTPPREESERNSASEPSASRSAGDNVTPPVEKSRHCSVTSRDDTDSTSNPTKEVHWSCP